MKLSWALVLGTAMMHSACPALALVGETADPGDLQRNVVMVLARSNASASFCTGTLLTQSVVLTAAHCVASPGATRIYLKGPAGQPTLLETRAIEIHPGFEKNAVKLRKKSIDLALVLLQKPLPSNLQPLPLSTGSTASVGDRFHVAGFGMTTEDEPRSGGTLHMSSLQIREPLSNVLLWLEGEGGRQTGACTGDSGAPVVDASGRQLLAVVAFAAGRAGHACGLLTQATLVAPQRAWIMQILQRWGE